MDQICTEQLGLRSPKCQEQIDRSFSALPDLFLVHGQLTYLLLLPPLILNIKLL